ncbi:hypothetical protein ICW40_13710 [Actinotalea ferrariae]|nr:hypothetical protein [Actinotalea ferrariae]
MALVLVVGSMLVLAMLAMAALAATMQSQKFARYSQDYTGAMAAAQAGIDDYISRLNRFDAYADSLDCTNAAMKGPTTVANTCGWNASTPAGWLPVVPGSTDPATAHFHYKVDSTKAISEGVVTLTSTGRVAGEYRTIEATIAKGGSTDYVYYTDFESADPTNVQAYKPTSSNPNGGATKVECGKDGYQAASYYYSGRNGRGCVEIQFGAADTLDGAVYSNDAIWSKGATFEAGFTSLNPGCTSVTAATSTWRNCLRQGWDINLGENANSTANFNNNQPTPPADGQKLDLEDTSAAFANHPGCHYFGSTRIIFEDTGKMRVWNKTASNGGTAPIAKAGGGLPAPTSCGSLADLDGAGALVNVPSGMVIYVAAAPGTVPRRMCTQGQLGGPTGRTLPLGTLNTAPTTVTGTSPSFEADTNMAEPTRYCAEGNLYAEGTLKGRVTLASAQSIIVTGDLVLAGGRDGGDILGLVATNSVEVMNPRKATFTPQRVGASCAQTGTTWRYCPGSTSTYSGWPTRYPDPHTNALNPTNGLQIAASIQTLQHSFYVQKYDDSADRGTLNVYGSIAQRWRGIVAQYSSNGYTTTTSGYDKLYQYDRRLMLAPPPYFPRWITAQWALRYSGEINTPATLKT